MFSAEWCKEEERSRRRGEETRDKHIFGEGNIPVVPRLNHWEGVPGRNSNCNMMRGRSRSFPAPPQNAIRQQPHSQPCCLTAGFGYVAPNAQFPSRINPPSHPIFNPPCPCQNHCPCHLPPPPPKMIPKVSPQSLLTLRMVTPSKQTVVAPKLSSFHF